MEGIKLPTPTPEQQAYLEKCVDRGHDPKLIVGGPAKPIDVIIRDGINDARNSAISFCAEVARIVADAQGQHDLGETIAKTILASRHEQ